MYPKLLNIHDNPYSVSKTMKNEKDQNVETSRVDGREREEEDEEEKKIDTFFNLIKSYQEARKRRREELGQSSGDVRKKTNVGETSGVVVPAFQPEDFSQCSDVKPLMAVSDHKEEDVKVKEEEEEAKKEEEEEKGLDLNLAL
ncbi:unnamed protein product [Eruca vesicaria subsp. sativa]|uniref:Protein NIM1-INTERACTING 1 n=1 Tax=Eruca vesicaria subsp. sativa TaxID=29727 RepID=A0ABC8KE18_ERUVS|nr:unnamed protein product [Eruca vesicaria subsp. sativa]